MYFNLPYSLIMIISIVDTPTIQQIDAGRALKEINTNQAERIISKNLSIGTILFTRYKTSGITIWRNFIQLNGKLNVNLTYDHAFVGIHTILESKASIISPSACTTAVNERQFIMAYLTRFLLSFTPSRSGCIHSIHIHYSLFYFKELVHFSPALKTFVQQATQRNNYLQDLPGYINESMAQVIQQLISNPFTGDLEKLFLHAKAFELLLHAANLLSVKKRDEKEIVNPAEMERIATLPGILMHYLDQKITTSQIARLVMLNELKLKTGFKKLFGTSIYQYLLQQRLMHADTLLKTSAMSISMIANSTGFSSPSHFTRVYKTRFGFSPSVARRYHGQS
jgi:AraC family transcriptional regulator, transcriptional activator of the genes for pyochelin and ferripyochelin receptors